MAPVQGECRKQLIALKTIKTVIILNSFNTKNNKTTRTKSCIGGDEAKYERYNGTPLPQKTVKGTVSFSNNANKALD